DDVLLHDLAAPHVHAPFLEQRKARKPRRNASSAVDPADPMTSLHVVMKPRILVAFDFGEPAASALAWAADLNRTTGGGPIHMVPAVDTRPAVVSDTPVVTMIPTQADVAALERRMRDAARVANVEATVEVQAIPQVAGATILEVAKR